MRGGRGELDVQAADALAEVVGAADVHHAVLSQIVAAVARVAHERLLAEQMREKLQIMRLAPLVKLAEIILLVHVRDRVEIVHLHAAGLAALRLAGQHQAVHLLADVVSPALLKRARKIAAPHDRVAHSRLVVEDSRDLLAERIREMLIIQVIRGLQERARRLGIDVADLLVAVILVEVGVHAVQVRRALPLRLKNNFRPEHRVLHILREVDLLKRLAVDDRDVQRWRILRRKIRRRIQHDAGRRRFSLESPRLSVKKFSRRNHNFLDRDELFAVVFVARDGLVARAGRPVDLVVEPQFLIVRLLVVDDGLHVAEPALAEVVADVALAAVSSRVRVRRRDADGRHEIHLTVQLVGLQLVVPEPERHFRLFQLGVCLRVFPDLFVHMVVGPPYPLVFSFVTLVYLFRTSGSEQIRIPPIPILLRKRAGCSPLYVFVRPQQRVLRAVMRIHNLVYYILLGKCMCSGT